MRLYHGSDQIVERPEIIHKDHKTDFGEGFYTTESKKQAESWANRVKIDVNPRKPSFQNTNSMNSQI